MSNTLVGVFDNYEQAQAAVKSLVESGVNYSDINVVRHDESSNGYMSYRGANEAEFTKGQSLGKRVANYFDSIFGTDINDDERGYYSEFVRRGSVLVTVDTSDSNHDKIADVLNEGGAVDYNRRVAQYRASGYTKYDENAPAYTRQQTDDEYRRFADQGEIAIPVIEENLQVGKQVVQRGGVRIHTRVTERPVEETVRLREETVNVQRRAVDRPVSEGDVAAVREGDFTVKTHGEEAVVAKDARVVEEVVVGKQVHERDEVVRDTVKRTDVEVNETNVDVDPRDNRR